MSTPLTTLDKRRMEMKLKSVAALALAVAAIAATSPASANSSAAGPAHVESSTSPSAVPDPGRSFRRHPHGGRYIVFRTPRYRAAPQIRRIRHAVVRLQLRVLAMQVRRLRYVAHHRSPRARVFVRGGGYRFVTPRPYIRLARHTPRVGFRRVRF